MMWVEETGYFTAEGTQRVLLMHSQKDETGIPSLPIVQFALHTLASVAVDRKTVIEERYLNKSFGKYSCPCIKHLLDGSIPYLSFGINDVSSCIHDFNESVPEGTLDLVFEQFNALFSIS
jgi:hypothetical protein